jgi:hypothetical protein
MMLVATGAWADSDGYYCVGHRYLAYQVGTNFPSGPHQLTVIRLGGPEGIAKPDVIEMPVAQVHGMRCYDDRIEVRLFTDMVLVPLDGALRPLPMQPMPLPDNTLPGMVPNLAQLSRAVWSLEPERVELLAESTGHRFVLEILPRDVKTQRCRTEIQTRILELDRTGRQVREREVHRGIHPRACGE